MKVSDIRNKFLDLYKSEEFVVDRTGSKTLEILGASFLADEEAIFGIPNEEYIRKEIDWYDMESANIYDLDPDPPAAWKMTANKHGEINSNYGMLIYGDRYYNQFDRVVHELISNPNSRRAEMIYTRPSVWVEAFENGKNDFICTNTVTYYIRDNKLHCVVQMRSNDSIFGYKNDRAWQKTVLERLCYSINVNNPVIEETYSQDILLTPGNIYWQVQNLHIYERHFHFLK